MYLFKRKKYTYKERECSTIPYSAHDLSLLICLFFLTNSLRKGWVQAYTGGAEKQQEDGQVIKGKEGGW